MSLSYLGFSSQLQGFYFRDIELGRNKMRISYNSKQHKKDRRDNKKVIRVIGDITVLYVDARDC
jgi:hypothetical protein